VTLTSYPSLIVFGLAFGIAVGAAVVAWVKRKMPRFGP